VGRTDAKELRRLRRGDAWQSQAKGRYGGE
jgi:hypothetical protein